jgi:methionyl-tRNA formyltransferase
MKKDLRIIYMGTPEFAVPPLEILINNGYKIVAVITAPDKPKGRGQQLSTSPVKDVAVAHNIPVLQPTNLKKPEFVEELKSYAANLQIVVAFRMLPEVVWDMPEIGTFNLHGSLLPQYRGAAPINWAIINGEIETGVTTFFLKHDIDTGNIIFQDKETISKEDNVGTVYERLMHRGAQLVLKTVIAIEAGEYPQLPQDESVFINHAPKIFKDTCMINWEQPGETIYNFIRGLSPYPAAWTMLNDKSCKVFKTSITSKKLAPGAIETDNKSYLHLGTNDVALSIEDLQIQGKKRMDIESFLRGNKL